jgi:hypothetical protein
MNYESLELDTKRAKFAFIGDLHIGSLNCRKEAFERTIDWCNENDAYVYTMGDLIDAITPNDVRFDPGNVDREFLTMSEQLDYVEEQLGRLKPGLFKGMVSGNHYGKWATKACVNEKVKMCKRLGGDFTALRVLLDIKLKESTTTLSFWHGAGGGYEMGAVANRMAKEPRAFDAEIYLMGHSHRLFHFPSIKLTNARLREDRQQLVQFVNTGCYLASYEEGIGGYGESKGYSPQAIGFSVVMLEDGHIPRIEEMMWYRGRLQSNGGILSTNNRDDLLDLLRGLSKQELVELIAQSAQ